MKRTFRIVSVGAVMTLLLAACRWNPQINSGRSGSTNPALAQSTPAGETPSALDQSTGQIDQSLNDLQNTLQALDGEFNLIDTGQVDQALNELGTDLQATEVATPSASSSDGDAVNQELDSPQQTMTAQPTP